MERKNLISRTAICLYLVLALVLSVGCSTNAYEEVTVKKDYRVIEIDNCEYIIIDKSAGYNGYGFMAHKGNCKYCARCALAN